MFPNPTAGTELGRYESTELGRYESAKPGRYESAAPVGTGPREQQCPGTVERCSRAVAHGRGPDLFAASEQRSVGI